MAPSKPRRMEPPTLKAPMVPRDLAEDEELTELDDDAVYSHLRIADALLTGEEARDVRFDESRLERVSLVGVRLRSLHLRDVELDRCDLSNGEWREPLLERVTFTTCKLTGFTAIEGRFHHMRLSECTGHYAAFRFSTFKVARFERCILTEADFTGSDLSGVVFRDCDLQGAQFLGAKLTKADLRGSNLEGIGAGPQELAGAIIEAGQAIVLARLLGLEIV